MASVAFSALSSAAATLDLEVPTDIVRTNDFGSLQNNAALDELKVNTSKYDGIDWKRLKGLFIPSDDPKIDSGIWRQGWRLWDPKKDRYKWLCRRCHLAKKLLPKSFKEALFLADVNTSGPIQHLKLVHEVDQEGGPINKKRKSAMDDYAIVSGHDAAAVANNTLAAAFDKDQFKAYLYDHIIANNVSFEQLESPAFKRLVDYLNPRAKRHIPSAVTASRTVAICYDKALGVVTESLHSAITKINLSFDLWTSKNKLALLGLCASFIDNDGNSVTSLLALPRQKGRHTGYNVAETVSDIIAQYGLQNKLGYFTTDNASANEKTLDYIAKEHGFERDSRWVRCSGHIFNLVGQVALFGSNYEAFEEAIEDTTIEELELAQWRAKGPIGKLHNIVYWVNRSPQRCERFEQLQLKLIAPTKPDKKKDTYELIKDVETRWNSFYYSAERACYLRAAIDAIMEEEYGVWSQYCLRCQTNNRPIKKTPPSILKDILSNDDWLVITRYIDILKPLKDATMQLQGHANGRFGAIWQVLPIYERILSHFERQVYQYPIAQELTHKDQLDDNNHLTAEALKAITESAITSEHHFSISIKFAWQKLDSYYSKLDNTALYVAAVVLHPRMKWKWIEYTWRERPEWIKSAKNAFNSLTVEYEIYTTTSEDPDKLPSPITPDSEPPPKRRRRAYSDSYAYESDDSDDAASLTIQGQLTAYLSDKVDKDTFEKEHSPIPYWLAKRQRWPHLSALALDVYSVPVMSDEPERVFSMTGAAISPRRRLLKSDKIAQLMCLKGWVRAGVIKLDR